VRDTAAAAAAGDDDDDDAAADDEAADDEDEDETYKAEDDIMDMDESWAPSVAADCMRTAAARRSGGSKSSGVHRSKSAPSDGRRISARATALL
jgi:hypothetical protein